LLKEYNNRWYLIAWNTERESIATFGLERIQKLEEKKDKFKVSPNFDSDLIFKHSIGITETQSKPMKVILSFNIYSGRFLKSQPIHPSQRVIKETANEIQIELFVLPTEELYTFILSYGPNVFVESPKELRAEIKNRLNKAIQSY